MQKILTPLFIVSLFTTMLFSNCNTKTKTTPAAKDTLAIATAEDMGIPGSFSDQTTIRFDSTRVKSFLDSFPKFKTFEKDITRFYTGRNYAYAWYDDKGLIETASTLYNSIQNIHQEGVPDSMPYKTEFAALMETPDGNDKIAPMAELMLTSQYLVYAKNVWVGLNEEQFLSAEWLLPRKKTSIGELLDSLGSGGNVLEDAPVYHQYNLLKEQLKKYHHIQVTHSWKEIKPSLKKYKTGDSSGAIRQIRERLFLLGDLPANNQNARFDEEFESGVKSFQQRFGYTQDGLITPTLMTEINIPINKRIDQVIVNMERCRWVPLELGNHYLLVNIPEYKLHVFDHDSLAFSMNVVVGKNQHKTVVFNGDMKYIVFSPYWNIPAGIMKKEILPALRRNRNYLARHNMEWHNGSIRQKPGPDNSLGLVKFLFPNSHNIYLHDTPAKSLFKEDSRAFSHGCIRLAEPKKLAMHLLQHDTAWTEEKITAAMTAGKEKYVTLKRPVPVFIAYFTAWVDKKGRLNLRKDIYDRNSRLAKMILEKPAI